MSRFENKKEIVGLVLFFVAAAIILIFYLPVSLTGDLSALHLTTQGRYAIL